MTRLLVAALVGLACTGVGCSRPAPAPKPAGLSPSDYAAPPELTGASRGPDGGLTVEGTAAPLARVRLASPSGAAMGGTAGVDGRWSITVPAGGEFRLLSLSQDIEGRLVRARGYLAAAPQPGPPAAILRPGAGARTIVSGRPPQITSVEFDSAGAGVVAGWSRPNQPVRVFLDGQEAGEGRADDRGWFDVTLSETLAGTGHSVIVTTPDGRAAQTFDASPAAPIATPPFAAERRTGAWRVDWMTPGGGVQTTVLFDTPETQG